MIKQRSGSIINISSVSGIMGNAGQVNYSASKAGLIGFSKSLAREVATRGVRVNAIAPGFIETDMTKALGDKARRKPSLRRSPWDVWEPQRMSPPWRVFLASDAPHTSPDRSFLSTEGYPCDARSYDGTKSRCDRHGDRESPRK